MMIKSEYSVFVIWRSIFAAFLVMGFGIVGLLSIPGAVERIGTVYVILSSISAIIALSFGFYQLVRMLIFLPDRTYLQIDADGRGVFRPWLRRRELNWKGPVDIRYDGWSRLIFDRPPVVGKLPVDKSGRTRLTLHAPSVVTYKGMKTDHNNRGNVIPKA